jgi:hypothetical protein
MGVKLCLWRYEEYGVKLYESVAVTYEQEGDRTLSDTT